MTYYTGTLTLKGDHGDDTLNCGIYTTESQCSQALFKLVYDQKLIQPMCHECENPYEDCQCDDLKNLDQWFQSQLSVVTTEKILDQMLDDYGDSYYGQNWYVKVFRSKLDNAIKV